MAAAQRMPILAWDAPAACPDEHELAATVARWLDLPDGRLDASAVRVEASVRAVEGGWRLDLTVASTAGSDTQTLTAESCSALAQVVALKVALAANPVVTATAASSAVADRPGGSPRPPRLTGRAALGGSVGVEPGAALGARLSASVDFGAWIVDVGASGWLPTAARYAAYPAVGASVSVYAANLGACGLPARGHLELAVCASGELGTMLGAGFGVAVTETSSQLWARASLGPRLRYWIGDRLAAVLEVDSGLAIERPTFHMRNLGALYRPNAVSADAFVGVEFAP